MTGEERQALRRLVSDAARARAAILDAEDMEGLCGWCGVVLEPSPNTAPRRFCCPSHRQRAWEKKRRERALTERVQRPVRSPAAGDGVVGRALGDSSPGGTTPRSVSAREAA